MKINFQCNSECSPSKVVNSAALFVRCADYKCPVTASATNDVFWSESVIQRVLRAPCESSKLSLDQDRIVIDRTPRG